MRRAHAFLDRTTASIAALTGELGERVVLGRDVLDRSDSLDLAAPGLVSANGSCRLIQTRDGWIAANLPRPGDLDDVPALLSEKPTDDAWRALVDGARTRSADALVERADMLGLALAKVGETPKPATAIHLRKTHNADRSKTLSVIDLSSLWAGPLCGAVFAAMGAAVTKIESATRPDPTPLSTPQLDQKLNGRKSRRSITLSATGQAELLRDIQRADILITSARARGLAQIGLTPDSVFTANPNLIWIAITGHGWDSHRIAFGDDAAASGGLLNWRDGEPRFIGDAIGDPLTGLAAAHAALELLAAGRAGFIDAALARVSAYVAGAPT